MHSIGLAYLQNELICQFLNRHRIFSIYLRINRMFEGNQFMPNTFDLNGHGLLKKILFLGSCHNHCCEVFNLNLQIY